MPQYEVLRDIGSSLASLIEAEVKKQKVKCKVLIAPPSRELFDKQAPALVLYLYEIRENTEIAPSARTWTKTVNGPDGKPVKVTMPPPLELDLRYVLAAGADETPAEHALLAIGMKALHEHPHLAKTTLKPEYFSSDENMPLRFDRSFDLGKAHELFTALGAPHKPAVGYKIPCRIFTDIVVYPAKRVEERDITVFDQIHPPAGKPTGGSPLSPAERRARGVTQGSAEQAGGVKKQ